MGALLAGRYPRPSRDLIWFGAGATSIWLILIGMLILHTSFKGGTDSRVIAAALGSIVLVILCDTVLIKEAFDQRLRTND